MKSRASHYGFLSAVNVVLVLAYLLGLSLTARAVEPTPQQIQQFMALPEAQRQQLAREFGVTLPESMQSGSTRSSPVTDVQVVRPLVPASATGAAVQQTSWPQGSFQQGVAAAGQYPSQGQRIGSPQGGQDLQTPWPQGSFQQGVAAAGQNPSQGQWIGSPQVAQYMPGQAGTSLSGLPPVDPRISPQGGAYMSGGVSETPGFGPQVGMFPGQVPGQQGIIPLKAFGYDLFAGTATTFAPVTEIPIPTEYRVGPGDTVRIQFFGKENRSYDLQIGRDGAIQIPELGPMHISGLTFEDLRNHIGRTVKEKFIGVESSVTLGELRSMRVFVLGESRTPGSYTVSSLSTITNALYVSGGVLESGSLRSVQLKRNGKTIVELDLYDLLLRGDTRHDERLQPGDVVFIPPVGKTVSIDGQVRRPAIYEIREEQTVNDLVRLAGGALPQANLSLTQVERVEQGQTTQILDVDLASSDGLRVAVRNGDRWHVGSVGELSEGYVSIQGAVTNPGPFAWRPGLTISQLLKNLRRDVLADADLNYGLLVREINTQREIDTWMVDLGQAISQPGGPQDQSLQELDQLIVFSRNEPRKALEPILQRLQQQAGPLEPVKVVSIKGPVRYPGLYPLSRNLTVEGLVKAGGGLLDSAYTVSAEVSRLEKDEQGMAISQILNLGLGDLQASAASGFQLQPRDELHIKPIPEYALRMTVRLDGEVRFPGEYTLTRGETLSQLIERAGGLTSAAFPEGAVFRRQRLAELELERLKEAEARLSRDLAAISVTNSDKPDAEASHEDVQQLQEILEDVRKAKPLGRLVIDLAGVLSGDRDMDIVLQDGDTLNIPQFNQAVSVIGEVQFPTSHLYRSDLTVEDYVAQSGGANRQADMDSIYVVRANGGVWIPQNSQWFGQGQNTIRPGDTVVVPLDIDRLNKLELMTNVSQIFYQIALGAAAVGSL